MNYNLLTKLIKRSKLEDSTMKSKLKKLVRPIALTTTTALLALSLSACQLIPGVLPDSSSSNNNNSSNIGNNSSSSNNNNNSSSSGNSNVDLSKYSALLRSVLNDSEVNAIIDEWNSDNNTLTKLDFQPHPYAFLQDQGHNIAKIKSGQLDCHTISYICDDEPNNLYMMTYVEDEGSKVNHDYFAEYHLKYTLTDQEMSEYKMLFDTGYAQAYFMNDAISEHKNEELLSKTYMRKESHETLADSLEDWDLLTARSFLNSDDLNILLKGYNDSSRCNLLVFSVSRDTLSCVHTGRIAEIPFSTDYIEAVNNVYLSPYTIGNFWIPSSKVDEYKSNVKKVTLYDTTHANLAIGLDLND